MERSKWNCKYRESQAMRPNDLFYIASTAKIMTATIVMMLHEAISQSLAGRTSILSLLPFNLEEISKYKNKYGIYELIVNGGYPRVYEKKMNPNKFYSNYFQTYIERDLRKIINLKNLSQFQTFLRLIAGRTGQLINYNSLSNDVGVSSTTIKKWKIDITN